MWRLTWPPVCPAFATVGLPDGAVKESKDRVRAALKNSGYDFPARRITANLAPADIKKEGAAYDLPISIGILAATGVVKADTACSSTLCWVNSRWMAASSRSGAPFPWRWQPNGPA